MSDFKDRKQARTEHYYKHVYGWKKRKCSACSGSGVYDNEGSPPCGACDGTGEERYLVEMQTRRAELLAKCKDSDSVLKTSLLAARRKP